MKKLITGVNLIVALCLVVAAAIVLAVSSVTTIHYELHCENDQPIYTPENIPLLIVSVVLAFIALYLFYRNKVFDKSRPLILGTLVFITVYCMMLILVIL